MIHNFSKSTRFLALSKCEGMQIEQKWFIHFFFTFMLPLFDTDDPLSHQLTGRWWKGQNLWSTRAETIEKKFRIKKGAETFFQNKIRGKDF